MTKNPSPGRARLHRRVAAALACVTLLTVGCLSGSYTTEKDKTARGAGIGAAAGAVVGAVIGEGAADNIPVGAAIVDRGVDPGRMTAIGYGEDHPVASNETAEGRSQNRRVTLLLKAKAR